MNERSQAFRYYILVSTGYHSGCGLIMLNVGSKYLGRLLNVCLKILYSQVVYFPKFFSYKHEENNFKD